MNTQEQPIKETIYYPMIGDYLIQLFISLEPKQVKQCLRLLLQKPSKLGIWERARIDRIQQCEHGLWVEACSEYGIWLAPLPLGVTAEAYYLYQDREQVLQGKYLLPLNQDGHLWQSRLHQKMKAQIQEAIANGVIGPHLDPAGSTYDGIEIYQEQEGMYEYIDQRASEQYNMERLNSFARIGKVIQVVKDY